jgi:hypothetical protein
MFTYDSIQSISKDDIQEASKTLTPEEISQLVEWLSLKDDTIRYRAFLLLQSRAMSADDVYPYWDIIQSKLKSDNSYQRSIGLMLIAENVRWDTESRMSGAIDEYLALLHDEKPITVRQCVLALGKIASYKPNLRKTIADKLISFDLMAVKETMRKLVLLDILSTLFIIRKSENNEAIDSFILNALSGEILDKKAKKQTAALFSQ